MLRKKLILIYTPTTVQQSLPHTCSLSHKSSTSEGLDKQRFDQVVVAADKKLGDDQNKVLFKF